MRLAALLVLLLIGVFAPMDILLGAPSVESAKRHSLLDLRFKNMIRQDLDYSCGAATLATLMTYYFDDPASEQHILDILTNQLSETEKANREYSGFSLLDLKRAAEQRGYRAAGYRLTFEQLSKLTAPVIVYITPLGYRHFAVLRRVIGDRVLLADPSRGNLRLSAKRFLDEWGGIAFVLGRDGEEDIGVHALSPSEIRDVLPDRLRVHRQLDVSDRVMRGALAMQPQQ